MKDAAATLTEETFAFPKYAAMVDRGATKAFVLGFCRQIQATKIVPVQIGSSPLTRSVVYEYVVDAKPIAAVLLRSAWLRPIGSMDGARPFKVQVLVDDQIVLDQPIDEHIRAGYPFPIRACSCNHWEKTLECKCPVPSLQVSSLVEKLYPATEWDDQGQAWPDRQYGIFAPHKTIVQIRVVKSGEGPVDFQARCGITAALYSTSTQDMPK